MTDDPGAHFSGREDEHGGPPRFAPQFEPFVETGDFEWTAPPIGPSAVPPSAVPENGPPPGSVPGAGPAGASSTLAPLALQSAQVGAGATLAALLVATVGSYIALGLLGSTTHDLGTLAPGGLRLGLWAFAAAFGAPVTGRLAGGTDLSSAQMTFSAHLPIALPLAVSVGMAGYLSYRLESAATSRDKQQLTGHAAAAGAVAAVIAFLAAKLSTISGTADTDQLSGSGHLGVAPFRAMLLAFIVVFGAAFIGRAVFADRFRLFAIKPARRSQFTVPLQSVLTYIAATAVIGTVFSIGYALFIDAPKGATVGTVLAETPLLGYGLAQFAEFVPIRGTVVEAGQTTSGTESLTSGDVSSWYLLLILLPLLALAVAAIRTGLLDRAAAPVAEPPPRWQQAATTGGLLVAATLLLNWYFGFRVKETGDSGLITLAADGKISAGLDSTTAILAALLGGAALPFLGQWLAPVACSRTPRLAAWLGRAPMSVPTTLSAPMTLSVPTTRSAPTSAPGVHDSAPVPAGVGSAAKPLSRKPLSRQAKLGFSAVAAVIVLALIAHGVVSYLDGHAFGPSRTAEQFLAAVGHGDASKALSYVHNPTPAPLLTNAVLAEQNRLGGITDIKVGTADISGDHASVGVTYSVAGKATTGELKLVKDGHRDGVFSAWRVVNPTATVELSDDSAGLISSVSLNGVTVNPSQTFAAFPGTFSVGGGSNWYAATADQSVASEFGGTTTIEVRASLTASGQTTIRNAIKQSVDRCLTSTAFEPAGCPFSTSYFGFSGAPDPKVKWTLTAPISFSEPTNDGPSRVSYDVTVPAHYEYTEPAVRGIFATPAQHHSEDVPSYLSDDHVLVDISGAAPVVNWGY
jgi:hypothetical protein